MSSNEKETKNDGNNVNENVVDVEQGLEVTMSSEVPMTQEQEDGTTTTTTTFRERRQAAELESNQNQSNDAGGDVTVDTTAATAAAAGTARAYPPSSPSSPSSKAGHGSIGSVATRGVRTSSTTGRTDLGGMIPDPPTVLTRRNDRRLDLIDDDDDDDDEKGGERITTALPSTDLERETTIRPGAFYVESTPAFSTVPPTSMPMQAPSSTDGNNVHTINVVTDDDDRRNVDRSTASNSNNIDKSSTINILEATLVESSKNLKVVEADVVSTSSSSNGFCTNPRNWIIIVFGTVIVGIVIGVAVYFGTTKESTPPTSSTASTNAGNESFTPLVTMTPTPAPTIDYVPYTDFLGQSFDDLSDDQRSALEWIVQVDQYNLTNDDSYQWMQRFVMAVFYYATSGPYWAADDEMWLTDLPVCNWTERFVCDDMYQVTEMNFEDMLIRGTLPSDIGNMTSLTVIDLDLNKITSTLPTEIALLSNLEIFWIYRNVLTGSIPSEYGSMSSIQRFDFDDNLLTGTIPSELAMAPQLEIFWATANQLNGTIPTAIGKISNLLSLDLALNGLTGSIPDQIGSATSLSYLDLSNNYLTSTIPSSIGTLQNLTFFDVETNQLTGTVPSSMSNMTQLQYLYMECNPDMNGTLPQSILDLPLLDEICIEQDLVANGTTIPSQIECSISCYEE